jgi:prepilin-type N-terminal cleavage/methylation domain-containing protein
MRATLQREATSHRSGRRGFTLVELLVAVTIAAIFMLVAIPRLFGTKKTPMIQAVTDLEEAFKRARSVAILSDRPMQVVIYGAEGTILVEPAPSGVVGATNGVSKGSFDALRTGTDGDEGRPASSFNARLHDEVAFSRLTVNGLNALAADLVAIRFFPNGTSDALDAQLTFRRDGTELFDLSLEILTGLLKVDRVR